MWKSAIVEPMEINKRMKIVKKKKKKKKKKERKNSTFGDINIYKLLKGEKKKNLKGD